MFKQAMKLALLPAAAAVLVACGGGGGGGIAGAGTFAVVGTAATGASIDAGIVKIYDAKGEVVTSGSTDANGKYSLSIPLSASAPFVIEIDVSGEKIYSIVNEKKDTRANVNQLTNALVAMLSANGNPELLSNELRNGDVNITNEVIADKKELIYAAIAPVKTAVMSLSQDVVDFHTGSFDADGTGLDKLLDTTNILTTAISSGNEESSVNVQIAFNVASNLENTQELSGFKFNSGESISQIASRSANIQIDSNTLPPQELGGLYQEFLARMRACYALPKSQRVSGYVIIADACKNIFIDSDPSRFKDGGYGVGPNRFGGIFTLDQMPRFSQALSPFLIHNITGSGENLQGKAVISFRGEDSDGNYLNNKVVVQIYTLGGRKVLGAVGDQNAAEFYVNAESVVTNFPLKNTDGYDYLSSGYSAWLPASVPGKADVKKAVLTSPNGSTITMGKWLNRNQLFVCKIGQNPDNNEVCNGLPTFVQGFRYADEQRHANGESPVSLLQVRSTLVYSRTQDSNNTSCNAFKTAYSNPAIPCPRTDAEIESQTPGGLWTAVYTFADNTTLTLKARHPVRALSNRELAGGMGPNFKAARLTTDSINALKSLSQLAVNDGRAYSNWSDFPERPIWAPATGAFQFAWSVDAGQEAPRKVKAIGRVAYDTTMRNPDRSWNRMKQVGSNIVDMRPNWEDELNFRTNTRSVSIRCVLATNVGDVSCRGATTGSNFDRDKSPDAAEVDVSNVTSDYANGVWMSTSLLWTSDNTGTNLMRVYSWFNPNE